MPDSGGAAVAGTAVNGAIIARAAQAPTSLMRRTIARRSERLPEQRARGLSLRSAAAYRVERPTFRLVQPGNWRPVR
jgi:hypothetical protein